MKTAGDADSEVGKKSRKRSIEKSKRPEFSKRTGMCQTLFSRNKEKRENCSEKKKSTTLLMEDFERSWAGSLIGMDLEQNTKKE